MKMHFHCLIEIRKQKHWAKEGWTHLSIFRSQDELVSGGFKVMTRQDKPRQQPSSPDKGQRLNK